MAQRKHRAPQRSSAADLPARPASPSPIANPVPVAGTPATEKPTRKRRPPFVL
jgi:hypothetical protein